MNIIIIQHYQDLNLRQYELKVNILLHISSDPFYFRQ